jgi:hypothetical protein
MILVDSEERTAVSRTRDRGLWVYNIASGRTRHVEVYADHRFGIRRVDADYFMIIRMESANHYVLTLARVGEPDRALASTQLVDGVVAAHTAHEGWAHVPMVFDIADPEPGFIRVQLSAQTYEAHRYDWFLADDYYDHGYQWPRGVTQVPGQPYVIMAIVREAQLVLYNPRSRAVVRKIEMPGGGGSSGELRFRRHAAELWSNNYDTLACLDPSDWRVLRSKRLQGTDPMVRQFVGDFAFSRAESSCAVARPFGGDVLGLDPATLEITHRAEVGGEPLEVALLSDGRVITRDWKTSQLRTGQLKPAKHVRM